MSSPFKVFLLRKLPGQRHFPRLPFPLYAQHAQLAVISVGGWRGGGKEGWKNGWRGECLTWPDSYFCNSRTFGVNEFIPFLRGYLLTIYCEPAPQLRPGLWQSSDPRDFLDSGNQAEVDAVLHSRLPHSVTGGVTGAEETPRPARAWEGSRRRCRPGCDEA